MSRKTQVAGLVVAVTCVAISLLATQPGNVFWGPDSGNHFWQVRSFLATGRLEITEAPRGVHHFVPLDGKMYSFYSPAFPVITSPLFVLLGTWGLFVIPITGTLAVVILLSLLLDRNYLLIAAATVFATPILWYTVVYWEHTLAVALSLGAFVLLSRQRPMWAGVAAAVGIVFREEGYIVCASLLTAMAIARKGDVRRRDILRFAAGALLVLVPLWLVNLSMFGHPLGLHAAVYSRLGDIRLSNWPVYLFEFTRWPATMRDTLYTQGFFPAVPLAIALAFTRLRDKFLSTTIVSGLLLTPLLLNQADFGIVWGPRHFLWLIPLVTVAIEPALRQSRLTAGATVLLIVLGIALQVEGVRLLRRKLRWSESLLRSAAAVPKPVYTDVFWIPEDLAATTVHFITTDAEIPRTPLLFIGTPGLRVVAGQPLVGRVIRRTTVADRSDPMLDAVLLDCR